MMMQGSPFTEMLALSKCDELEQRIRDRHLESALVETLDQAHPLRTAIAAALVRLAAIFDAGVAGRAAPAAGR